MHVLNVYRIRVTVFRVPKISMAASKPRPPPGPPLLPLTLRNPPLSPLHRLKAQTLQNSNLIISRKYVPANSHSSCVEGHELAKEKEGKDREEKRTDKDNPGGGGGGGKAGFLLY
jgi:hypothetical protein